MRLAIFVITLFAATGRASAQNIDGWEIEQFAERCSMSSIFEDEVTLSVFWEPGTESSYIILSSVEWDSLRSREGEDVRVELNLIGQNVEYNEWWDPAATIMTFGAEEEGVIAHWEREHQIDFATSFALADSAGFTVDGRSLGRYNLAGTYQAMLALRQCGARILKEGGDPFD